MKKINLYETVVFIFFLIFLSLQFHFVFPLFDDFGYATLSYADLIPTGEKFSLGRLVEFLYQHYMRWGGRVLYFALEVLLLQCPQCILRGFFALCTALVWLLGYRTSIDENRNLAICIFSYILYGVFSVNYVNEGFYWYTAAILYVVPFIPMFCGLILAEKEAETCRIRYICNGILFFIASWSQEQISVIVCSCLGIRVIYKIKEWIVEKKKICIVREGYYLLCAVAGLLILLLCPGSWGRMKISNTEMGLFEKLTTNANTVLPFLFGDNWLYVMILSLTMICISIFLIRKVKQKCFLCLEYLFLLGNVLLFLSAICRKNAFRAIQCRTGSEITVILFTLYLVSVAIETFIYGFYCKKRISSMAFIASIPSVFMMYLLAGGAPRTVIPCMVLTLFLLCNILNTLYFELNSRMGKYILAVVCIYISICACFNLQDTFIGYYENSIVNSANDEKLKEASVEIKNGKSIEVIELTKLPRKEYATNMPYIYDNGIGKWMHYYYDIPLEVTFDWK